MAWHGVRCGTVWCGPLVALPCPGNCVNVVEDSSGAPNAIEVIEPTHRASLPPKTLGFDRVLEPTADNEARDVTFCALQQHPKLRVLLSVLIFVDGWPPP
jgi:hypothetical protein